MGFDDKQREGAQRFWIDWRLTSGVAPLLSSGAGANREEAGVFLRPILLAANSSDVRAANSFSSAHHVSLPAEYNALCATTLARLASKTYRRMASLAASYETS